MTGCRKETRLPVPFFSSSLTLLFDAYFPRYPASPFRLKFLPTIRADLLWTPLCHPPLLDLSLIVLDPAPVATKPPPPSCTSFPLLHYVATFRTDVYLSFIIPFCVVISVPTLIAAVMARWDKAFSTIQAFQFFSHTFTPLLLFYTMGGGALLFDAYLELIANLLDGAEAFEAALDQKFQSLALAVEMLLIVVKCLISEGNRYCQKVT